MIEASNLSTQLYFISSFPLEEVVYLVGQALDCEFTIPDIEAYDDETAFRGNIFGINFILQFLETWSEGAIYRLTGTCDDFEKNVEMLNINFHVAKLLKNRGLHNVMDRTKFVEIYNQH
jgi:hypothetical protein